MTEWIYYVTKSLEIMSSNFFSCRSNKEKINLSAHTSLLENSKAKPYKKCNHKLFNSRRLIKKPKCFKDILTSIWVISINKPFILLQTSWAGKLSFSIKLASFVTQPEVKTLARRL